MNAGSSLTKWAPYDNSQEFRTASHPQALDFLARNFSSVDPEVVDKLIIQVSLSATDSASSLTNHIKAFFKALRTYNHLKVLDMQRCNLSDQIIIDHFLPMLQCNTSIEKLLLAKNAFTTTGALAIFEGLASASCNVTDLDISDNKFKPEVAPGLNQLLATDKLKSLDISRNEYFGAEGLSGIIKALKATTNLKTLSMNTIKLDEEGGMLVADLLKPGNGITKLNIQENNFGCTEIEYIMNNFKTGADKNKTCKSLDISKNMFTDKGFEIIVSMMQVNTTLISLKMNKCGITTPKFIDFCEKMLVRYQQPLGPHPQIEELWVGANGLGNDISALTAMLKHKNCRIRSLNYEGNEVTDFGAKKWKEFLVSWDCNRIACTDDFKFSNSNQAAVSAARKRIKEIQKGRLNFCHLSLKSNAITADGAEHLAAVVTKNKIFNNLDLRVNKIGVKGAIFFKKAFRKRQCSMEYYGRTFKFHIMPGDVGVEGVNHLAISLREGPLLMHKFMKTKPRPYTRPQALVKQKAAALQRINPALAPKPLEDEAEEPEKTNDPAMHPSTSALLRDESLDKGDRFHGGGYNTKFKHFNTPKVPSVEAEKQNTSKFKRGIELCAKNEEKEDAFGFLMVVTYTAMGLLKTDRNEIFWNKVDSIFVKMGWGCVIGNILYRYGLMIRLQYAAESPEYIEDLYIQRYSSSYLKTNSKTRQEIVEELVADDLRMFWEQLMPQTSNSTGRQTMFEFVLKNGASPLLDPVRQFLNVFPAHAYMHGAGSVQRRKDKRIGIATVQLKSPVFLEQVIAASGKTYRDLCLESKDKFVKRYAEEKNLVLFRFLIVEPVYKSKFIRISKVEDLLLTEEYDDSDRFFYMRQIARSSEQEDAKLAQNDYDCHLSFMTDPQSYIDDGRAFQKVENIILKKINADLDIGFVSQISQLHHREQFLTDDKLVPAFSQIYKTDLKTVLDNQSIAGGRNLDRSLILLRMIAESLDKFNTRNWVKNLVDAKHQQANPLLKEGRIHGNVKPRNIVLRVGDELPDLDGGVDLMPGKWVLTDFTRSTKHKELYIPDPNSAYNPPEVAKRVFSNDSTLKYKIPANEKMDVWQFGCVLFEVLSGTTLFKMEARDDSLLLSEDRAELVNWLCLDEERLEMVLAPLRTYGAKQGYSKKDIETIIKSAQELVQMCLQGDPTDRPMFTEVLNHPFLNKVNMGKTAAEKDLDDVNAALTKLKGWVLNMDSSFFNEAFKSRQPHVHLVNTEFEQAGAVVRSLEQTLSSFGCRITTDSDPEATNSAILERNVKSARVVCCFLTSDAFYKPSVIKQLLIAEDYRQRMEKAPARVCFLNLNAGINLAKHGLAFNKPEVREKWTQSDSFQYLVKSLAEDDAAGNLKLIFLGIGGLNSMYDDLYDSWNKFLNEKVHPLILSYIQKPVKYQLHKFLVPYMLDEILHGGKLVRLEKLSPYEPAGLSGRNFLDGGGDLEALKMQDHKDKFMGLYFLPAKREKKGAARVFVLTGSHPFDDVLNAVSEISQALESPSTWNRLSEEEHKDPLDYRNKMFSKVKNSYNLKKESDKYLKVGGRYTKIQKAKDKILNIERTQGELVVVLFCIKGVFKRYSEFLHRAVSKRDNGEFIFLLVEGFGWKPNSKAAQEEIEKFCPDELKAFAKNSDNYLPYYKAKKDEWQFEATMVQLVKDAVHKMEHPVPSEKFLDLAA